MYRTAPPPLAQPAVSELCLVPHQVERHRLFFIEVVHVTAQDDLLVQVQGLQPLERLFQVGQQFWDPRPECDRVHVLQVMRRAGFDLMAVQHHVQGNSTSGDDQLLTQLPQLLWRQRRGHRHGDRISHNVRRRVMEVR
jgi:hypothetical protein